VAHAAEELHLVALERHAGAAAVAEPARASSSATSPVVMRTPAAIPSSTPIRAGPWDSPAVSHRTMASSLQTAAGLPDGGDGVDGDGGAAAARVLGARAEHLDAVRTCTGTTSGPAPRRSR
jgi:hypothetical protein